ncbi:hypothetical protein [Celeribacter indicus]|uniref:Uncharacterized protein n=1 Tax=Celeribacter indicus TaxID=1208324 RepID=A0A0B5E3M6_9RHOB|nr:hypothetical protein [Celeribacter indicus]AJE47656.1 hypothetical protein P73_2941 [Celeribacter indicus]SDW13370.1 hypothetical protein SAMN05443573_101502 [Celeribacter indicus]
MAQQTDWPDVDPALDPGGLIRESYRIEGLGLLEARSIFLDWAIKLDPKLDATIAIRRLLALYAPVADPAHPMTRVLEEGLGEMRLQTGRRGGSRGRRG